MHRCWGEKLPVLIDVADDKEFDVIPKVGLLHLSNHSSQRMSWSVGAPNHRDVEGSGSVIRMVPRGEAP
jgi:hypothetical protein